PPKGSPFDDDAALALLLAESLAERGEFDANDVAQRWLNWMKRDGRGIGLTTQRALRFVERGMEPFEAGRAAHDAGTAASNGSVMRCIPVALRHHANVDKLVRVSVRAAPAVPGRGADLSRGGGRGHRHQRSRGGSAAGCPGRGGEPAAALARAARRGERCRYVG